MYYSNDYLAHYGVQGMKWGQHLMAKAKNVSNAYYNHKSKRYNKYENDRRVNLFETKRGQNIRVSSEKREAANRVKYYGGTNAAKAGLISEISRKTTVTALKGAAATQALAIGGAILDSASNSTGFTQLATTAGVVATGVGIYKQYTRGLRQYAYTKDQDHQKIKMVD